MLQKATTDTKPELKWVPLSKLYIPVRYQRALEGGASLRNIDYIQKNFNWAEFGTLLVGKTKKENEKYGVIDGQHRFRAAELRDDIEEVPCVIISPREVADQAKTFLNINSRRVALNPLQYYRAALVAGDTIASRFAEICKQSDVVIPTFNALSSQLPADNLQCVGNMQRLMASEKFTDEDFVWCLSVIRNAHPKTPGALRYNMVRSLLEWVKISPKLEKKDIIKILKGMDLYALEINARESRIVGKNSIWKAYLALLQRRYATFKKEAA